MTALLQQQEEKGEDGVRKDARNPADIIDDFVMVREWVVEGTGDTRVISSVHNVVE